MTRIREEEEVNLCTIKYCMSTTSLGSLKKQRRAPLHFWHDEHMLEN